MWCLKLAEELLKSYNYFYSMQFIKEVSKQLKYLLYVKNASKKVFKTGVKV